MHTSKSLYLRQAKHVVDRHLTQTERATLRTWLRARYDSAGRPHPERFDPPGLTLVWDAEAERDALV